MPCFILICCLYGFSFHVGEENAVFVCDGLSQTYNDLRAAHPEQDYEFFSIPGYGHLDSILGKNAVYDVYPHILRALDKYADDGLMTNRETERRVAQAMKTVKRLAGRCPKVLIWCSRIARRG